MKKLLVVFSLILGAFGFAAVTEALELTPNTRAFSVSGFFYFESSTGNFQRYQSIGFYETPVPRVKTKVFLMPHISVKKAGVSFIGNDGRTITDEDQANDATVAKIRVSMQYDGNLPDNRQKMGVLSQIYATGETVLDPQVTMADLTSPTIGVLYNMPPQQKDALRNGQLALTARINSQGDLLRRSENELLPQVVAINAVSITLLVDGEVVGKFSVPGSLISSGTLPDLFLAGATNSQINRFKERQFQIRLDYSFLDANTGSIIANFDFEKMMNQIVREERVMQVSSTKSGVSFLGFGNRKSKISQFLRESTDEKITQDNKANTVIQMNDADESMVAMFESKFFPQVSREHVINAHLEAAEVAKSTGNEMLAKAHLGYAQAVQEDKIDLSVDTAGALASLSAGDYAGFIAKGVKMQKSETSAASQYSRVMTKSVDVTGSVDWTLVKSVSTQRSVSQIIEQENDARKAYLGLCDFVTYDAVEYGYNPPPHTLHTIVPTCLVTNGPLARAGVAPGAVITKVGGTVITNTQSLENLLSSYRPGETLDVQLITRFGGPGQYHNVENRQVKLGRGQPQ